MSRALLLLLALSFVSTGCARRGSNGGDDDDAAPSYDFGALDTNGDGELTSDDVANGASLAMTVPGPDGDEELLVENASVSVYANGEGDWVLNGGFSTETSYWWFTMNFENGDWDLEPGVGNITRFQLGEKTSMGRWFESTDPGGMVEVTDVVDWLASGHIADPPAAEGTDPMTEEPTGESAILQGLAFADLSYGAIDG